MKCTDGNNANIVHEHYNLNWYMDLHNIYKMTQSILIHYVLGFPVRAVNEKLQRRNIDFFAFSFDNLDWIS